MPIAWFPSAEDKFRNQCTCCGGKFGLVRHRKDFKQFCSQRCADRYRLQIRGANNGQASSSGIACTSVPKTASKEQAAYRK